MRKSPLLKFWIQNFFSWLVLNWNFWENILFWKNIASSLYVYIHIPAYTILARSSTGCLYFYEQCEAILYINILYAFGKHIWYMSRVLHLNMTVILSRTKVVCYKEQKLFGDFFVDLNDGSLLDNLKCVYFEYV